MLSIMVGYIPMNPIPLIPEKKPMADGPMAKWFHHFIPFKRMVSKGVFSRGKDYNKI